jgi:hypothetical protein
MNTYGLEQVIRMWEVEQLTTEQTIGQILLLIREDRERMNELERRLGEIERGDREGRGRRQFPQRKERGKEYQ